MAQAILANLWSQSAPFVIGATGLVLMPVGVLNFPRVVLLRTVGTYWLLVWPIFFFFFWGAPAGMSISDLDGHYALLRKNPYDPLILFWFANLIASLWLWRSMSHPWRSEFGAAPYFWSQFFVIGWCAYSLLIFYHAGRYGVTFTSTEFGQANVFFQVYALLQIIFAVTLATSAARLSIAAPSQSGFLPNAIIQRLSPLAARKGFFSLLALLLLTSIYGLIHLLNGGPPAFLWVAFSETSSWSLSQHPVVLHPHEGHYLCTVAARGYPGIVQPTGLGERRGDIIVVNRQLQIANAFEEMVQEFSPAGHRLLRGIYDRYGLPICRYLQHPVPATLVYLAMKPLEWFFLLSLKAFDPNPEARIRRQYSGTK